MLLCIHILILSVSIIVIHNFRRTLTEVGLFLVLSFLLVRSLLIHILHIVINFLMIKVHLPLFFILIFLVVLKLIQLLIWSIIYFKYIN